MGTNPLRYQNTNPYREHYYTRRVNSTATYHLRRLGDGTEHVLRHAHQATVINRSGATDDHPVTGEHFGTIVLKI